MNTNASEPTTRRKPAPWRWATGRHIVSMSPENGTASRLRRWIRAVLQALKPAPATIRPETPADRTPRAPNAAFLDSRELSPWSPFSPRF
ncbi:MAG: hypothetical protein ABSG50_08880 [Opitutaceae bacterium]